MGIATDWPDLRRRALGGLEFPLRHSTELPYRPDFWAVSFLSSLRNLARTIGEKIKGRAIFLSSKIDCGNDSYMMTGDIPSRVFCPTA
jgi:hypothetical protein